MNSSSIYRQEKGTSLLETLLALAITGVVAVTFLSGLATGSRASITSDEQITGECLARSQVEYVKNLLYQPGATEYPVSPDLIIPVGWSVLPASAVALDTPENGRQRITVTVQRNGATIFTMSAYKIDR